MFVESADIQEELKMKKHNSHFRKENHQDVASHKDKENHENLAKPYVQDKLSHRHISSWKDAVIAQVKKRPDDVVRSKDKNRKNNKEAEA